MKLSNLAVAVAIAFTSIHSSRAQDASDIVCAAQIEYAKKDFWKDVAKNSETNQQFYDRVSASIINVEMNRFLATLDPVDWRMIQDLEEGKTQDSSVVFRRISAKLEKFGRFQGSSSGLGILSESEWGVHLDVSQNSNLSLTGKYKRYVKDYPPFTDTIIGYGDESRIFRITFGSSSKPMYPDDLSPQVHKDVLRDRKVDFARYLPPAPSRNDYHFIQNWLRENGHSECLATHNRQINKVVDRAVSTSRLGRALESLGWTSSESAGSTAGAVR